MIALAQCFYTSRVKRSLTFKLKIDYIVVREKDEVSQGGNQPPAEHLAYLSSAGGITQVLPHGQDPAMLLSGCRKLPPESPQTMTTK